MQRRIDSESIAQSEFCELREHAFVNSEKGVHAVHAAQPQLLHETTSSARAKPSNLLAASACLAENTPHIT
jgi:hypothetical protein